MRVGVVAVLALVLVGGAAGRVHRSSLVLPVAELRSAANMVAPDVTLPTRLPPGIAYADVGAFCNSPGVNGPPCRSMLEYVSKPTGGATAFQLAVYDGRVAAAVVRALLRHDGKAGSTAPFTAGKVAGTRELQHDARFKVGWVESYAWESGKYTYLLVVKVREGGAPTYAGTNPLKIIASFGGVSNAPAIAVPSIYFTIPDVLGLTRAAAAAKLTALGLKVTVYTYPAESPGDVGKVIDVTPRVGRQSQRGGSVAITIGK